VSLKIERNKGVLRGRGNKLKQWDFKPHGNKVILGMTLARVDNEYHFISYILLR
jgi:hypothetical protein